MTATTAPITVTVLAPAGTGGASGSEQVYDIQTDQLNTPRLITNGQGNTVWQWLQTEPFGNTLPNQDPNNSGTQFVFNLRFAGQYADIETGLFYNYFRDYDPLTGRYVESDPIGLRGGQLSTYPYVGGQSLTYTDIFGLASGGASIGGQIGSWGAGIAGVETGPFDIPIVAAGRAIGSAVGSAVEDAFFPTPSPTVPPANNFTPYNLPKDFPIAMAGNGGVGNSSGIGTNTPYKHCKEDPNDPNFIICKDPNGKKVRKKKPADWPKKCEKQ